MGHTCMRDEEMLEWSMRTFHLQNSYPAWDDLAQKAVKLSVQLRTTIVALDQFLDSMQKISDYATNTKGPHVSVTLVDTRSHSLTQRLIRPAFCLPPRLGFRRVLTAASLARRNVLTGRAAYSHRAKSTTC